MIRAGRPHKGPMVPEYLLAGAKLRERIQWFMDHQIWAVKEETLCEGGPVKITAEMTIKNKPVALTAFSLPGTDAISTTRLHIDLMMAQHLATQT